MDIEILFDFSLMIFASKTLRLKEKKRKINIQNFESLSPGGFYFIPLIDSLCLGSHL